MRSAETLGRSDILTERCTCLVVVKDHQSECLELLGAILTRRTHLCVKNLIGVSILRLGILLRRTIEAVSRVPPWPT